jgi:hypothetical protein
MNTESGVMFLSTVLLAALLASQNGLTSDILNQANLEKVDSTAFAVPSSGSDRMFQGIATNETPFLVDIGPFVADKFSSAETRITNEPASLDSTLSSVSTTNETASRVDIGRLVAVKFSNGETRITNEPSSLDPSLPSVSTANETASCVDIRPLISDKFSSSAETRITNESSSLDSNAFRQGPDQRHEAEQSEGLVQ